MRATDAFGGPFTPPGFYYKTFIQPPPPVAAVREGAAPRRRARTAAEARGGARPGGRSTAGATATCSSTGGGIAGLAAALRAAELGADVVLCDDGRGAGRRGCSPRAATSGPGPCAARAREAGVEILSGAARARLLRRPRAVWQGDILHQVRARGTSRRRARSSNRSCSRTTTSPA